MEYDYLLVGGAGRVGFAIREALSQNELEHKGRYAYTIRHPSSTPGKIGYKYDLLTGSPAELPKAKVIIWCAAAASFAKAECHKTGWHTNVDAPLSVARYFMGTHFVFLSSDAVDWAGHTALGRQKAAVEAALAFRPLTSVVRPNRVEDGQEKALARFVLHIAANRLEGMYRWVAAPLKAMVAYGC